jgi:hypothetical protein
MSAVRGIQCHPVVACGDHVSAMRDQATEAGMEVLPERTCAHRTYSSSLAAERRRPHGLRPCGHPRHPRTGGHKRRPEGTADQTRILHASLRYARSGTCPLPTCR